MKKPEQIVLTVDILKAPTVNIEIDLPSGELYVVALRMPTIHRWYEIESTLQEPKPPMRRTVKNGKPVTVEDRQDPEYVEAMRQTMLERRLRRVADALIGGGNLPELADKPLADQAAALRDMDMAWINVLEDAIARHMQGAKQRSYRQMADNFRPVPEDGVEDLQPEELDPESVVGTAG